LEIIEFKNPYSTTAVASAFEITLKNSAGIVRATDISSINLINYLPDSLLAASMEPMNPMVGAVDTHVQITVRIKNPIRPSSKIVFYIPRWNPDEGADAKHMILVPSPLCLPLAGLGPFISCSYKFET